MASHGVQVDEKSFGLSKRHLHYGEHFVFYPTGENDLEIVLRDCLKTHCLSPRQTEIKILKVFQPPHKHMSWSLSSC